MGKAVKRFVARLVLAVVIVLAAYAGWKGGDAFFPQLESVFGIGEVEQSVATELVTPQAAEVATDKIETFRESDAPELRLASFEVSSLLRYSVPGMLPRGVVEPSVAMEGDRIEIQAGVVPSVLPKLPDLGAITGILPDTVPVSVTGSLVPFGDAGSMLLVREISVQGIPIPTGTFPDILAALGRKHMRGLPASAILVPAFTEIKSAYIENGELVLVRA